MHQKFSSQNLYFTRFVAAVGIVMVHFYDFDSLVFKLFANRLGEAVNYFFFLSGFVMVITYSKVLTDEKMDFRQVLWFYWRRFARIYPLYVLAFIFCIAMQYTTTRMFAWNKAEFILEILGLQRLFFYWSMNFPAWTISVEFVFYMVFPFLFPFLSRLPIFKMCIYVISFYICALGFNVFWGHHYLSEMGEPVNVMDSLKLTIYNHPFLKLAIFILGNCCGILFLRYAKQDTWVQFVLLPTFMLICYLLWAIPKGNYWLEGGVLCPLYFVFVWSLCIQNKQISKLFGSRFCVFLGDISYGVYILQVPVFLLFRKVTGNEMQSLPLLQFLVYLLLLIAVSSLLYYAYERPLKSFILRKARAKLGL